jgi:hypothetical protein
VWWFVAEEVMGAGCRAHLAQVRLRKVPMEQRTGWHQRINAAHRRPPNSGP